MGAITSLSLPGYQAALTAAAIFRHPNVGYLRVGGSDRIAFLQRQSTNDLRLLGPDDILVTVLTSPTARILDVLTLIADLESLGAITLPGRGGRTARFLHSRIFFMDQVTVDDASSEFAHLELLGPRAGEVLKGAGLVQVPDSNKLAATTLGEAAVRVFGLYRWGYWLVIPAVEAVEVQSVLESAGAVPLAPESYNILRVEAGLPTADHELTEEYTPLETGLEAVVSDTKGCYTGQEVIARQITYDKVTRQLVGLKLEGDVSLGDRLRSVDEDRPTGTVTSLANSPRFGPIALAIVRRPYHTPGTDLLVGSENGAMLAKVVALPFSS